MPQLSTPFTDIDYLDHGPKEGTPVVLVHGFPDGPSTWDQVLALLPPGVRTIRPYLRGVGGTRVRADAPDARSGQVAALAADLLGLVDGLRLERFLLVGHDWGARTAHAVAALQPHRLTGLITLATPYGPRTPLSATETLDDTAVAWYRYWLCTDAGAAAFRVEPQALVRWAWRHWSPALHIDIGEERALLAAFKNPEFIDDVISYYRHGAGEEADRAVYADAQAQLDAWPAIAVPTTFLIGAEDGCETLPAARTNGPWFSAGRELIELPGVGHFVQREAPEAVADAIRGHLAHAAV